MKEKRNATPIYKKKWLIVTIVAVIILIMIGSNLEETTPAEKKAKSASEQLNISEDTALSVFKACEESGMDLDQVEIKDETSSGITLSYWYNPINVIIKNNKVDIITSLDGIIYEDGKTVKTPEELFATPDQRSTLIAFAQLEVEKKLKDPKSAKFPKSYSDYRVKRIDGGFSVSGSFSADNDFGQPVKNQFTVNCKWDGTDKKDPVLTKIEIK